MHKVHSRLLSFTSTVLIRLDHLCTTGTDNDGPRASKGHHVSQHEATSKLFSMRMFSYCIRIPLSLSRVDWFFQCHFPPPLGRSARVMPQEIYVLFGPQHHRIQWTNTYPPQSIGGSGARSTFNPTMEILASGTGNEEESNISKTWPAGNRGERTLRTEPRASRHRYGAIGCYERTLRTGLLALRTEQGRYERSFFPPRPHQDRAISPKGQDITESCAVGALVEVVQEQSKHGVT